VALAEAHGDATELGVPARRHHDAVAAAVADDRAHQGARGQLGEDRPRRDRRGGFRDRRRLAGEHRFVALEVRGREQAQVGGHARTKLYVYDVAGHELGHVALLPRAAAAHDGAVHDA
jgi:hypothetical protein